MSKHDGIDPKQYHDEMEKRVRVQGARTAVEATTGQAMTAVFQCVPACRDAMEAMMLMEKAARAANRAIDRWADDDESDDSKPPEGDLKQ